MVPESDIFTEFIPFYGRVPLGKVNYFTNLILVFYMPQASQEDEDYIMSHGGLMSNLVECFTMQIAKRDQTFNENQFFPGNIYDF